MGGPFDFYSFDLPKPLLHLLFLLNRLTLAVSLLLVLLRLRPPPPPPPPPPSQSRSDPFPQTPAHLPHPESQPPSTSTSLKNRLPVVDFARLAGDSPPAECVVCLGGFAPADEVRELGNCRHAFHKDCIDRWIDADGFTCPLCRSPLLPAPEEAAAEEKGRIVGMFARIRGIPFSLNLFITNLFVDNYL